MFASLYTRTVALLIALISVLLATVFALIDNAGIGTAHKVAATQLAAGARTLDALLEQDTRQLAEAGRLVAIDPAFREGLAGGDVPGSPAAIADHDSRPAPELVVAVDSDKRLLADSVVGAKGEAFWQPSLLADAERLRQGAAIAVFGGRLYHLVAVPVQGSASAGWVTAGSRIDDAFARELHRLTGLQVSFLARAADHSWRVHASTLAGEPRSAVVNDFTAYRFAEQDAAGNVAVNRDATRVIDLGRSEEPVAAILQQPLGPALEPFRQLQRQLALISLAALAVAMVASFAFAGGIVRSVNDLAHAARRMAAGKYASLSSSRRSDEIGDLVAAFRAMQAALAAREARITDLAYRDALTGLPNRTHFTERLDEAIAAAEHVRTPVTVALVDLDRFQHVNDTLGLPIGDLILREVAARLQGAVEKPGVVARLGGDEFAILLPGQGASEAQRVAQAIVASLERPLLVEGHRVEVRPSIGIAAYPDHGEDGVALLQRADLACHSAARSRLMLAS